MQVEKPATSRVVDDGRGRQVRRHVSGAQAQRTLKVALDLVTRRARLRRLPNEIEILCVRSPRRSYPQQAGCDGHAHANGPTAAARTHREAIAKATNEQKLFVLGLRLRSGAAQQRLTGPRLTWTDASRSSVRAKRETVTLAPCSASSMRCLAHHSCAQDRTRRRP